MKRLMQFGFVVALAALTAAPAFAQGRPNRQPGQQPPGGGRGIGGGGGPGMLIAVKSVQEELKLTEDQIKKITDASRERMTGLRDIFQLPEDERRKKMEEMTKAGEKMLADNLKPEQLKRLKEVYLQYQQKTSGLVSSLSNNRELADTLKLNDEQKEALKALAADREKLRTELGLGRPAAGGGARPMRPTEEQTKKLADHQKASDEKVTKILTDDQKAKLKELTGAPFTGEITFPRPGGGA